MKYFFACLFVLIQSISFAQSGSDNRFEESEKMEDKQVSDTPYIEPEVKANPGNPGDTVPIDDYLPLLIFAAVAVIFYKSRQIRKAI